MRLPAESSPASVIELPFDLPGHIYRSPMPFRISDSQGEIFRQYQVLNVSVVVLLASDDECLERAGRNLRIFYEAQGLEVINLPISDFDVPTKEALERSVTATIERARAGNNIAAHCYAGYGRTGMFMACLARRVLGMSAEEAIRWVRVYVPGSIEVPEQIRAVMEFQ
jgi:protein-tyrosine phosphatase